MVNGKPHLFLHEDGSLVPTDLVRGPWDHGLQHGGAICGALAWAAHRAVDADDPGCAPADPTTGVGERFQLCRLTAEILRPVPVAPLTVRASIAHRGRRSRVVSAELLDGDRPVARASTQWAAVRAADGEAGPPVDGEPGGQGVPSDPAVPRRPSEPHDPGATHIGYPRPGFNCDVFELRCLVGSTEDEGPGVVWARMSAGLVAGTPPHPIHALAAASDLANAVGWERSPNDRPMINTDVTLQLERYPRDGWVCLEAKATATAAGIGIMETTLWDGDGRFGRVLSTIVESPVALAIDLRPLQTEKRE